MQHVDTNTQEFRDALAEARACEKRTGKRHYITWCVPEQCWHVCGQMPLMGTWFDAEGIRHG